MGDKEKISNINEVLSKWNPIGVPDDIAKTEYMDYVLKTLSYKNDFIGLVKYLEYILVDCIELEYNKHDVEEKKDILYYAYLIYEEIQ